MPSCLLSHWHNSRSITLQHYFFILITAHQSAVSTSCVKISYHSGKIVILVKRRQKCLSSAMWNLYADCMPKGYSIQQVVFFQLPKQYSLEPQLHSLLNQSCHIHRIRNRFPSTVFLTEMDRLSIKVRIRIWPRRLCRKCSGTWLVQPHFNHTQNDPSNLNVPSLV